MIDWSQVRALSFDCYGTLIDWESGILQALAPWVSRFGSAKVLAGFGAVEPDLEHAHPIWPYRQVVAEVYRQMARELDVASDDAAAVRFADSIANWPPFPDTIAALRKLKSRFQLFILSNVDEASILGSLKLLAVPFDGVFTAEQIGSYKPNPRNFDFLLAQMAARGITPQQIVHVAQSLYHDHGPAQAAGLKTVWIDRTQGKPGATRLPHPLPPFDLRFETLGEFAARAVTTH
ncbi:haloacid dehalogenase type II [Pedomonas mirosovicensis]|uniref:haloacid dehalogenase type II n=1 Tax=Pedomonas mirosovicensis TaxID=2908641 RepID=UPI002167116B|nr:haloacid dehalogenase type II [Pedomonas mirosovicensis]MCH8686126.1 haloacid dehalogenase type II [Pedomonas mirosovicensis]